MQSGLGQRCSLGGERTWIHVTKMQDSRWWLLIPQIKCQRISGKEKTIPSQGNPRWVRQKGCLKGYLRRKHSLAVSLCPSQGLEVAKVLGTLGLGQRVWGEWNKRLEGWQG